jgi:hypothetical protein
MHTGRGMQRLAALVLATAAMLAATIAAAEPTAPSSPAPAQEPVVAIAMSPMSWVTGQYGSYSASLRLASHHALRVNVATYGGRDYYIPSEATFRGGVTDVSAGWEMFPRSLWSGFSVITDVVYRRRDTSTLEDAAAPVGDSATDTRTLAVRAQIAWTWHSRAAELENLFATVGIGVSGGREVGRVYDLDDDLMTRINPEDIRRYTIQAEWFGRVGWVFGR